MCEAMCGECEVKETFDVMINVRSCTITRQVTLYLAKHVNILMGRNIVIMSGIYGLLKNKCTKLTQICAQRIFKFCQN